MAGSPAPLAAVQAAVLKSAAGKHAQSNPGAVAQLGAVNQDLAVMADQAKGYTAGVLAGADQAGANRTAQAARLAAEKEAADAVRASQLEAERLQTARYQESVAGAQAHAEAASSGEAKADYERQKALQAADAAGVIGQARLSLDPNAFAFVQEYVPATTTYDEAMALFKNLKKYGAIPKQMDEKQYEAIARAYHSRLQGS